MRSNSFFQRIKTFKNNLKNRFKADKRSEATYRPSRDDVTEHYEYEHRKDPQDKVLRESGGQDISAI